MVRAVLGKLEKEDKDMLTDIDIKRVPNYFKDKIIITNNYQGYIGGMGIKPSYPLSKLTFNVLIARRDINMLAKSWSSHKHDSRPIDKGKILSEDELTITLRDEHTLEELIESIRNSIETTGLKQEQVNAKFDKLFSVE